MFTLAYVPIKELGKGLAPSVFVSTPLKTIASFHIVLTFEDHLGGRKVWGYSHSTSSPVSENVHVDGSLWGTANRQIRSFELQRVGGK